MLLRSIRSTLAAVSAVAALALPLVTQAGPYSSIYVFGDSLSDTGTLAIAANFGNPVGAGLPPLPQASGFWGPYYNNQQLSDGPVWVNHLAAGLGLPAIQAQSFFVGGNNFAFAGARTGAGNSGPTDPPGLLSQSFGIFGGMGTIPAVDPNALYVVVGGGNDMRDSRADAPGVTAADQLAHAADALQAIQNLGQSIGFLASKGAKHFLISTLPDLGITPEANLLGLAAASSDATDKFNALIPVLLAQMQGFGLDMHLLDMAGAVEQVLANPGAHGVTNTSLPCNGFAYAGGLVPGGEGNTVGTACANSIFSDVLHPSARMHELIAQEALEALGVPEPESLALFALALLAGVATTRRRA